jgi:hypothetical protein
MMSGYHWPAVTSLYGVTRNYDSPSCDVSATQGVYDVMPHEMTSSVSERSLQRGYSSAYSGPSDSVPSKQFTPPPTLHHQQHFSASGFPVVGHPSLTPADLQSFFAVDAAARSGYMADSLSVTSRADYLFPVSTSAQNCFRSTSDCRSTSRDDGVGSNLSRQGNDCHHDNNDIDDVDNESGKSVCTSLIYVWTTVITIIRLNKMRGI